MRLLRTCTIVVLTCCLAGCNWFGGGKSKSASESVFSVQPGQCFVAPATVKAELSDLTQTPCTQPHTQEAYAIVQYQAGTTSASNSAFPGNDVLSTFAQGACAQHYADYVGVDYLDSKLFFTYLLPSPRSWEQNDDYKIICFVTTTGGTLTSSVKGSKK
ncbi:MAG: septum formation family protein [Jatrophihabitantaceae bacterium]